MRILFIYPQVNSQVSFNYGLSHISSILKTLGHETFLININQDLGYPLDYGRIVRDALDFSPDIIGFSIVTPQFKYALGILRALRKSVDACFIAGGVHPTLKPEEVLRAGFDYVCRGEGEPFFPKFIGYLEGKVPIESVPNMSYLDNGVLKNNPLHDFVDLSTLPMRDYGFFDFQHMLNVKGGWAGLMASRGCPFRCSYCVNHAIIRLYREALGLKAYRSYVRYHRAEDVVREMEFIVSNYKGVRFFIFDDDLFTFSKKFVDEFCELYKSSGIGVPFVVNSHVKVFDEEVARKLKEAGCRIVKFGIESGSERIRREVLNRHMKNSEMERAIEICKRVGLHSSCFVMIGLPTETEEDMFETIKFLSKSRPGRFRWSVFYPFPGTEAYRMCEELGILPDNVGELDNFFDGTCLLLDEKRKKVIERFSKVFPWFVNSHLGGEVSRVYGPLAEASLNDESWSEMRNIYLDVDKAVSSLLSTKKSVFYSIKFNRFMAVRSDWEE